MIIEDLWYKNAIVYSLDLETFMDSNGDGVGDFEGLTRRLDYLQTLGVTALWLAPFQPTPNRDNGYDIADYYGVDPRHGNGGDFVEFLHQANKRGMRVLIDLVVNHTSTSHPWFQDARKNPESRYRDWYVWSKKRPKDWDKGMIFPGVQQSTWSYDQVAKLWYYHRFYEHQPDLNVDNPEVRHEIRRIVGYWLQLGVAGFRLDAVPFMLESTVPERHGEPLHFDYLYELHRFMEWRRGDAVLLGEANVTPQENKKYFGPHGDGIHLMFNFWVNQRVFLGLATGDARPLVKALRETRAIPAAAQWAHFLRNHDELDLGRLSDEEREAVYAAFAPDEGMRLYDRGIRRRLAPMLGDRPQLEMAYSLLLSLPGTPVLRYGDEIGMGEDLSLDERDAVRTPMQWADEPQAGFSTAERTIHPVIDEGVFSYHRVNVESQRRDPGSMLNWTVRMIRLRKECPEIGWGDWKPLPTGSHAVIALCYAWRNNCVIVVHNFSSRPVEIRLRPDAEGGERLVNLIEEEESIADDGTHRIVIGAYGYKWYRVGGLNYAVNRRTY